MIDVIVAKTHTSDYLLHKYWARKPHNVLKVLISDLVKKDVGVIVDPFCGSGVFLREASKLGHKVFGFDVNPIAAILSDITCNPPNNVEFRNIVEPILDKFKIYCDELYLTSNKESVRYYVHDSVVECPICKTKQTKSQSKAKGTKSFCVKCDEALSFSLGNLIGTKITHVVTESGVVTDIDEIKFGASLETLRKADKDCIYDLNFPQNKRILAFDGMKTRDLFTERNFFLLSLLADMFHAIEDQKIKEASLLLLTASVAQCSRLIAFRNNLTTGGPAWSVPGFWVPAQHLETNPYKHLIARYKKFLKGIEQLNKVKVNSVTIVNTDCINLSSFVKEKVDLFFLDPPYGDSIPYMEFSMIWNSFLKRPIQIDKDISVSDRNQNKAHSWKNYKSALIERIKILKNLLAKDGKFLITFNNHDYRAWEALIEALQSSNMVCVSTMYQIPAVVSSKAQFSRDGSYISDIYSVYKYDPKSIPKQSLENVRVDLIKSGIARGGKITRSVLYRSAFVSILKNNVSSDSLKKLDLLIEDLYKISGNDCLLFDQFKDAFNVDTLESICKKELIKFSKSGKVLWDELYAQIAGETRNLGIPEPSEIILILGHEIDVVDGKVIFQSGLDKNKVQIDLFD